MANCWECKRPLLEEFVDDSVIPNKLLCEGCWDNKQEGNDE